MWKKAVPNKKRLREAWWRGQEKLSRFKGPDETEHSSASARACGLPEDWQILSRRYSLRERFFIVTIDGLRKLVAAGMTIRARSMSHPVLPQMTCEAARTEIEHSGRFLEKALGERIWSFAYPFGDPAWVGEKRNRDSENVRLLACAFVNYGGRV